MTDRNRRSRSVDVREVAVAVVTLVVFVACVIVVIVNQQTTGWMNLAAMLVGLAGLIVLLGLYNRRFR